MKTVINGIWWKVLFLNVVYWNNSSSFSQPNTNSKDTLNLKVSRQTADVLNDTRMKLGLDSVQLSSQFSLGCYNHAKYLVKNRDKEFTYGLKAHDEIKDAPFYTKSGAIAGSSSVILKSGYFTYSWASVRSIPNEIIESFLNTYYHRLGLISPCLKSVGIGIYFEEDTAIHFVHYVVVIDVFSGAIDLDEVQVTYYPANNQTNVPVAMHPELPDPFELHNIYHKGEKGFPITISFDQERNSYYNTYKLKEIYYGLYDDKNQVVDCILFTPANSKYDRYASNTIAIFPKNPLKYNMRYKVYVSFNLDGKVTTKYYYFETEKERGPTIVYK